MTLQLPKLIGHRGVKDIAPENTIESIKSAINFGLNWVEIDVKISKDQKPFLLHDDTLDRTTSGKGSPLEFKYKEIIKLNAGKWFDKKYRNVHPPSLESVLSLCLNNKVGVNIELKPNKGFEQLNVKAVSEIVKKFNMDYYFSSFDWKSVILIKKLNKNFNVGVLIDKFKNFSDLEKIVAQCCKYNFFSCSFNIELINEKVVSICKNKGIHVGVYSTQNIEINEAFHLWRIGVDTIFIDNPKNYKRIIKDI
ncbi:MAG: Glycerophosphoryl diester phosphodiesterase [Alphaproteobacteria bacterium MarineAlpha5_Bin9]|nr:MAG: Glycerophosphoryl diester phosphodiesterase [Alphaproteobacteria bacterium MarineAlpha5_Bin9]|tara:strand:+ start:15556 stop:16308 length:753 start_codon:yes stop_codon:yes gene_type:complete